MKRSLIIIISSLLTFSAWGQEVEMFSLEKELDFTGIPKKTLQERSHAWFRTLGLVPSSEYDLLTFIGYRADWVKRNCNLQFKGKDYRTEYNFSISVISHADGHCTFRLYRPLISSYRGDTTILRMDNIPVFYGGYNKGMFGAFRNKEARIAICNEVKRLLTEEFESMIPDLTRCLEDGVSGFDLVQE